MILSDDAILHGHMLWDYMNNLPNSTILSVCSEIVPGRDRSIIHYVFVCEKMSLIIRQAPTLHVHINKLFPGFWMVFRGAPQSILPIQILGDAKHFFRIQLLRLLSYIVAEFCFRTGAGLLSLGWLLLLGIVVCQFGLGLLLHINGGHV